MRHSIITLTMILLFQVGVLPQTTIYTASGYEIYSYDTGKWTQFSEPSQFRITKDRVEWVTLDRSSEYTMTGCRHERLDIWSCSLTESGTGNHVEMIVDVGKNPPIFTLMGSSMSLGSIWMFDITSVTQGTNVITGEKELLERVFRQEEPSATSEEDFFAEDYQSVVTVFWSTEHSISKWNGHKWEHMVTVPEVSCLRFEGGYLWWARINGTSTSFKIVGCGSTIDSTFDGELPYGCILTQDDQEFSILFEPVEDGALVATLSDEAEGVLIVFDIADK